jgi:hypothetical protein
MNPVAIIEAASLLFKLAIEVRSALMQKGEWTPEQEAEFQNRRQDLILQPWWIPEGGTN